MNLNSSPQRPSIVHAHHGLLKEQPLNSRENFFFRLILFQISMCHFIKDLVRVAFWIPDGFVVCVCVIDF